MHARIAGSYHHGNLREALLEAALKLVETTDERELSLRTLATAAGVSNGAPYRHFEDRQSLLTALAAIGFDRLTKAFHKSKNSTDGRATVAALATAYLAFAARNPGLYRLMFTHNHLAVRFDETLAKSAAGAFRELEFGVRAQLTDASDANLVATALWATVHGVAMLTFERLLPVDVPSNETHLRMLAASAAQLVVDRLMTEKRERQAN